MRKIIVGGIGPCVSASEAQNFLTQEQGKLLTLNNFTVLTGGKI